MCHATTLCQETLSLAWLGKFSLPARCISLSLAPENVIFVVEVLASYRRNFRVCAFRRKVKRWAASFTRYTCLCVSTSPFMEVSN